MEKPDWELQTAFYAALVIFEVPEVRLEVNYQVAWPQKMCTA